MRKLLLPLMGVIAVASAHQEFLAQPVAMAADTDNLSCIIYDSLTVFNMKALEDPVGYSKNGFRFNFCKRFNITNSDGGQFVETYAFKESADSTV